MRLWRKFWIYVVISGCILLWYFGTRAVSLIKEGTRAVSLKTEVTRDVLFKKETPLITLFTSWNAFPEAFEVYNNTLRNWPSLQPHANIILFTNDVLPDVIKQLGWMVLPVKRQIKGHPVLKQMFIEAMKLQPDSKLYGFANGDMLFTNSLINSLLEITNSPLLVNKTYMVVGRRMSTPNVTREEASSWETIRRAANRGELMNEMWGIDYFLTSPGFHWEEIPEVQIGQSFYDNWLVWDARRMGYEVIDATDTLLAVHQNAPYPKQHGKMDNNLNYFSVSRSTLYNKGVVPCCKLHTVYVNRTITLQRRKQIPKHCTL